MNLETRALLDHAAHRMKCLVDRLVWRIRRMPKTGIWGDRPHRHLWDELAEYAREGGPSSLEFAFEATFMPFCQGAVGDLDPADLRLLWFLTYDYIDTDTDAMTEAPLYPDAVVQELWSRLRQRAAAEPERDWN